MGGSQPAVLWRMELGLGSVPGRGAWQVQGGLGFVIGHTRALLGVRVSPHLGADWAAMGGHRPGGSGDWSLVCQGSRARSRGGAWLRSSHTRTLLGVRVCHPIWATRFFCRHGNGRP